MPSDANPSPPGTAEKVLDPARALTPAAVRVNEVRVRRGFWPKMARVGSRIPFAREAMAAWYATRDPETPFRVKAMVLAALGYFVLPVDAIPDVFAGIGFTDDAAVIAAMLALIGSHIRPRHYEAAERALHGFRDQD